MCRTISGYRPSSPVPRPTVLESLACLNCSCCLLNTGLLLSSVWVFVLNAVAWKLPLGGFWSLIVLTSFFPFLGGYSPLSVFKNFGQFYSFVEKTIPTAVDPLWPKVASSSFFFKKNYALVAFEISSFTGLIKQDRQKAFLFLNIFR